MITVLDILAGWWFGTWLLYAFIFPYIGNVSIPTDEHIFVSEGWLNHQPA
jgi:hypothetical protein